MSVVDEHTIAGKLTGNAVYTVGDRNKTEFTVLVISKRTGKKQWCECILWQELADKFKDMKVDTEIIAEVLYSRANTWGGKTKVQHVIEGLVIVDDDEGDTIKENFI